MAGIYHKDVGTTGCARFGCDNIPLGTYPIHTSRFAHRLWWCSGHSFLAAYSAVWLELRSWPFSSIVIQPGSDDVIWFRMTQV